MRLVIQRVLSASVIIDGVIVSEIDHGLVIFIGITHDDTVKDIICGAKKIAKLRIFNDKDNKMNLSLQDTLGQILLVSQFTLYGNTSKGNRPSFIDAARPEFANNLYELMKTELKNFNIVVECGVFGADMQVSLVNDGPVTIILES